MAIEGVDYADARPSPSGLVAAGKKFVVRYGGMGRDSKQLHASELAALRKAGLDVVANVEGAAGGYRGASAGRTWAESGEAWFRNLGMPSHRPIYFSVDWDAGVNDYPVIDAALRASAEIIGKDRVGVYGSYDVVRHCQSAGTAKWFWQTYAWSGGRLASGVHLYQYHNSVTVAGGVVDLTRALIADYGQWEYDMPLSSNDVKTIANTDGVFKAPPGSKNADGTPNEFWSLNTYVINTYSAAVSARTYASDALTTAKQALAAVQHLADPTAIAQAVIALLPQDRDDITQEEVTIAVNAAFEAAIAKLAPSAS